MPWGRRLCTTCIVSVCGEQVSADGTHGLACRKSAGRHFRRNAVNSLIKRTLASAETPAILELSWVQALWLPMRNKGKSLVQQPVSTVQLHANCHGDFWSHRWIGDGLLPAARMPHSNNDCWDVLICIFDAASKRCYTAWQCSLHSWDCTIIWRLGHEHQI